MAVRADHRVGVSDLLAFHARGPDRLGQVFQVHLVADAGPRRNNLEVVKGVLSPAQEFIAFPVALELTLHVLLEGIRAAEEVDHDGVVDHQVAGRQGIDLLGIATEVRHGLAHGGQVDHGGNAGEVLHQHARRAVGDFAGVPPAGTARRQRLDIVDGDAVAILEAQQVLKQNLQGKGQAAQVADAGLRSGGQAVVIEGFAVDLKGAARLQAVLSEFHDLEGSLTLASRQTAAASQRGYPRPAASPCGIGEAAVAPPCFVIKWRAGERPRTRRRNYTKSAP